MNTMNRSAVVVNTGQPFLDWLHGADPTSAHLTLSDLQSRCKETFEEQLEEGWFRVPTAWPTDRTFKAFKRWFEYHFHSVLIDLASTQSSGRSFEPRLVPICID